MFRMMVNEEVVQLWRQGDMRILCTFLFTVYECFYWVFHWAIITWVMPLALGNVHSNPLWFMKLFWGVTGVFSEPHSNKTSALVLEPLLQSILLWYFGDRVSNTICLGWHQTLFLPTSVSLLPRITGPRHWPPGFFVTFYKG
jgi:hypothetical protein